MTEDSVENLRKLYKDHKCDNFYCHKCNMQQNLKLLEKFLFYLPPEALEVTEQGVRVINKFMVKPDGTWKNYNKRGWYRYSTVKKFISMYISPIVAHDFDYVV